MQTSQTIGALAAALAKAQGQMKPAEFDRTNPHFKNKYATLPAVMAAVRGPLAANGIAIVQGLEAEGAKVRVTMTLAHASGEWMSSTLELVAAQNNVQGLMSVVSYGRRYLLSSMCGVVADDASDDDGEEASRYSEPQHHAPPPKPPAPPLAKPTEFAVTVWNKSKAKWGNEAKAKFEAACVKAFGTEPVPTEKWDATDAKMVEQILFPEILADVPF
jgi:hypothetical protein